MIIQDLHLISSHFAFSNRSMILPFLKVHLDPSPRLLLRPIYQLLRKLRPVQPTVRLTREPHKQFALFGMFILSLM